MAVLAPQGRRSTVRSRRSQGALAQARRRGLLRRSLRRDRRRRPPMTPIPSSNTAPVAKIGRRHRPTRSYSGARDRSGGPTRVNLSVSRSRRHGSLHADSGYRDGRNPTPTDFGAANLRDPGSRLGRALLDRGAVHPIRGSDRRHPATRTTTGPGGTSKPLTTSVSDSLRANSLGSQCGMSTWPI